MGFQAWLPLPLPEQLVVFGLGDWSCYSPDTSIAVDVLVSPGIAPQRVGTLQPTCRLVAGAGAARVSGGMFWTSVPLCGTAWFWWWCPKAAQACQSSTMVFLSSDPFSFLLVAFSARSLFVFGVLPASVGAGVFL